MPTIALMLTREDSAAIVKAALQLNTLPLDDDLLYGPYPADVDAWVRERAERFEGDVRALAGQGWTEVLKLVHEPPVDTDFIIFAGPERAQQWFVGFMMSVLPDAMESGNPVMLSDTPRAPALCSPQELRAARAAARAIDDMQVRMAASAWRAIADNVPIAAAEIARMVEAEMPLFKRAVCAWADGQG